MKIQLERQNEIKTQELKTKDLLQTVDQLQQVLIISQTTYALGQYLSTREGKGIRKQGDITNRPVQSRQRTEIEG